MRGSGLIRRIAARMPAQLRELRAKLMLDVVCESLGVEEVACPACKGTGRLKGRALERCPVCCGFQEVPDRLADWFNARLGGARAGVQRRPTGRPARRPSGPVGERYGRLAEQPCRVHMPSVM